MPLYGTTSGGGSGTVDGALSQAPSQEQGVSSFERMAAIRPGGGA
jgi:hypothetical protein